MNEGSIVICFANASLLSLPPLASWYSDQSRSWPNISSITNAFTLKDRDFGRDLVKPYSSDK